MTTRKSASPAKRATKAPAKKKAAAVQQPASTGMPFGMQLTMILAVLFLVLALAFFVQVVRYYL